MTAVRGVSASLKDSASNAPQKRRVWVVVSLRSLFREDLSRALVTSIGPRLFLRLKQQSRWRDTNGSACHVMLMGLSLSRWPLLGGQGQGALNQSHFYARPLWEAR
jgi:hypothetical protein